jgi:hypothetical protein
LRSGPFLPFIAFLALLCTACVTKGESSELRAVGPPAALPDRISCEQILGSAYRSDAERAWFHQNCSQWPPVKVDPAPAPASANGQAPANGEPPECASIRGRPYESSQQREFFLKNCHRPASPQPATTTGNVPAAGDRTDCNAITGTPYRSERERGWYLQNCRS